MGTKKGIFNLLGSFWLKYELDIVQIILALILIGYIFLNTI